MLRRKIAALLVGCAAVGSGCSTSQPSDELMVVDNPKAAVAAVSPQPAATPAGTVTQVPGAVPALAFDPRSRTLAVAVDDPPSVLLYDFRADTLPPPRTILFPAPVETLSAADGAVLATAGTSVTRITLPGGQLTPPVSLRGTPASTATVADRTLVALRDERAVAVLEGDKFTREITGGLLSADQVLAAGRGAVVLDRLRNAVFELDVRAGTVGKGLRAGTGATNAVADRFGRVLVADTRGGALLAFSLDPLLLRQNYPVPGAPYGIAYDAKRDLVWVTLTETNEVVGYHVAGEQPRERHRFPTVAQPNSVTVDPISGRVVVASATGKGIQVIAL